MTFRFHTHFHIREVSEGLLNDILPYIPNSVRCLIEPFCGSGVVSIAAAAHGIAKQVWLYDVNEPLMELWTEILERPNELTGPYEKLWNEQYPNKKELFFQIRDEFNVSLQPHHLL